jgi:HAE1 family hydrophobic/amphiphilic exporter-1
LFTTPVIYLYLDNLSNALSRWMRSREPDDFEPTTERGAQKDAAE